MRMSFEEKMLESAKMSVRRFDCREHVIFCKVVDYLRLWSRGVDF